MSSGADKKRRGRRRGGGLRRHQEIENVKVEESFSLFRFHREVWRGMLREHDHLQQQAILWYHDGGPSGLKEASTLWFQDQADSFELNRRMKLILEKEEKEQQDDDDVKDNDDSSQPNKKLKVEKTEKELPPLARFNRYRNSNTFGPIPRRYRREEGKRTRRAV